MLGPIYNLNSGNHQKKKLNIQVKENYQNMILKRCAGTQN
jgi:hypothetical protein